MLDAYLEDGGRAALVFFKISIVNLKIIELIGPSQMS